MTNNINVLEVLESKPNGTKLWCVLFGKCFLDGIDINNIRPIRIGIEKGDTFKLTANAKLGGKYIDGDCLLYPSKEMRDWSKFAWKKGNILISSDGGTEVIFDKWYDADIQYLEREMIVKIWKQKRKLRWNCIPMVQ